MFKSAPATLYNYDCVRFMVLCLGISWVYILDPIRVWPNAIKFDGTKFYIIMWVLCSVACANFKVYRLFTE